MRAAVFSMQGLPPPRRPMRAVAVAAAGAAAGGAAGWALARRQQRLAPGCTWEPAHHTNAGASTKATSSDGVPQQAGFTPYATPLHEAVAADDGEAVQWLLGAATNKRALAAALDEHGNTAMAVAAIQGKEKAARALLIAAPETAAKKNSQGATPLFLAAQNGHEGVVDLLLNCAPGLVCARAGKPLHETTAAHAAAAQGHTAVLKRILKAEHVAAWDEDMHVRHLALQFGGFRSVVTTTCWTACLLSAWHPCTIACACDRPIELSTPKCLQERTPLNVAELHGQHSAAKVLRSHMNRFSVSQVKGPGGLFNSISIESK